MQLEMYAETDDPDDEAPRQDDWSQFGLRKQGAALVPEDGDTSRIDRYVAWKRQQRGES